MSQMEQVSFATQRLVDTVFSVKCKEDLEMIDLQTEAAKDYNDNRLNMVCNGKSSRRKKQKKVILK